jgi:hypothetical protein
MKVYKSERTSRITNGSGREDAVLWWMVEVEKSASGASRKLFEILFVLFFFLLM